MSYVYKETFKLLKAYKVILALWCNITVLDKVYEPLCTPILKRQ